MFKKLEQSWNQFKEDAPGERFQQHFKRRQQSRRSVLQKVLFIGGGTLIMAAGVFFLPAPGPGTLVLFIGASLIAQESLLAARALDWLELHLRRLITWSLSAWRRSSPVVKALLVLLAVVLAGAVAFGAYKLLLTS